MPYLDCPRCHATFHVGPIYESLDVCPRCGAPFRVPRPRFRDQIRGAFGRPVLVDAPDWEAITSSQYRRRGAARTNPDEHGDTPAAA